MHDPGVIEKTSSRNLVNSNWIKLAAAMIVGAFASWIIMQSQLSKSQITITDQQEQLAIVKEECNQLNLQYAFINHTNTIPMVLRSSYAPDDNQVIVYWNQELKRSLMRVVELPSIQSNETYQLWADVDGEMLSLGVFDAAQAITDAIPMSYLDNATSLNITIEPKGGSEHPTVSRLTASAII